MRESALIGLAVLKVNWDLTRKDYVESFVPLIVECVRLAATDVVSLPELQRSVRERFGIQLPLNALKTVLSRAVRHGFIRRQSHMLVRDSARCAQTDFAERSTKVESEYNKVVSAVVAFAAKLGTHWSSDAAESAILRFMATDDTVVLFAAADQTRIQAPRGLSDSERFIVASFVSHSQSSDQELFAALETLARGNVLATAMFVPDPGGVQRKFRGTLVYLDTRLLLHVLGYAGPERQAPAVELIQLLKESDAKLACFQRTADEVRGVLDYCAARIRLQQLDDAHGEVLDFFLAEGYTSSSVDLIAARVPEKLALRDIAITDFPAFDDPRFQIDELAFDTALRNAVSYPRDGARRHDVDCISAISRLRRGRTSRDMETSGAVFVTTNVALARTAKAFFKGEEEAVVAPVCITDYVLGNLLWLKSPTLAPDLPRRRIIADAYAALQPREALWKSYLAEIARLRKNGDVTESDYFLLRHSTTARTTLMDLTRGEAGAFTEGSVPEILAAAQREARAQTQAALDAERAERVRETGTLQVELSNVTEAKQSLAGQIDGFRDLEMGRRQRVGALSMTVAKWIVFVPELLVAVLVFYGVLASYDGQRVSLPFIEPIGPLVAAVAAMLAFGGAQWGASVSGAARWLEKRIARALAVRVASWLNLDAGLRPGDP